MAGLDPKTVFSSLMDRKGSITGKTWGNWLEGKSRPRRTTIRRFYESVAANSISDDSRSLIVDKIEQQMQKTEAKEEYPFFLEWGLFLIGVKLNAPSHLELFICEAERLVELTRAIMPYVENKNLKGLARALRDSSTPKTDVTIQAIRLIEESNQLSGTLLQKALLPIILTNTLYLIACLDTKQELLTNLCPQFSGAKIIFPLGR